MAGGRSEALLEVSGKGLIHENNDLGLEGERKRRSEVFTPREVFPSMRCHGGKEKCWSFMGKRNDFLFFFFSLPSPSLPPPLRVLINKFFLHQNCSISRRKYGKGKRCDAIVKQ